MPKKLSTKIGVSAIAWLNDDMPTLTSHINLEKALKDIQRIGFKGTENGGAFPKDSKKLAEILSQYNLELVSGWYSGKLSERSLKDEIKAIDSQINLFKDVGAELIVYGETSGVDLTKPLNQKPTLDNFNTYANKIDDLAKYCNDSGMPIAFHHHMGTKIENMNELSQLMDLTHELQITFDSGHCLMAGGNPISICKKYANRIAHFHLKDIREKIYEKIDFSKDSFRDSFIKGIFTVPGDGCIDFDQLVFILKQVGYEGWFVIEAEQDPKKADPYEYSAMGYNFLYDLLKKHHYQIQL